MLNYFSNNDFRNATPPCSIEDMDAVVYIEKIIEKLEDE